MKYSIPVNKLEKLEKIIKKYQKKGAFISFQIGDDVVEEGTVTVLDHIHHCQYEEKISVKCKEVFVEGTYIINNWQFVGTIEFTENGNIIRIADSSFSGKVPVKYLHTDKICEHCGKIRNRKDTYLIYNIDSGEFKQVGSSCLLDYTQGLDADKCASIMSCLDKVLEISNKEFTAEEFCGNGYDSTGCGMPREMILPIAYAYVKQYGYQRMENGVGTAQDILMMIWGGMRDEEMVRRYESLVMPTDEELKAIDEVAKDNFDNIENAYMRNASLAWTKKEIEYRDFSLVASFVNACLKKFAKDEQRKQDLESRNNVHVGNIGDRVTINVASARVLYTKDNSYKYYYAGCSYVWEIIDTKGHVFKWSASTSHINAGDVITATIKEHSEYKGVKQTIITHGKVAKFND